MFEHKAEVTFLIKACLKHYFTSNSLVGFGTT